MNIAIVLCRGCGASIRIRPCELEKNISFCSLTCRKQFTLQRKLGELSAEEARDLFIYDPKTGFLRWRNRRANVPAGTLAGYVNAWGYVVLSIRKKRQYAHRVIWLIVNGYWPNWPLEEVDHINGDKQDNRIDNLRLATRSQNLMNAKTNKRNRSGLKGAHQHRDKWSSVITRDGVHYNLGSTFNTAEEAHRAYTDAALQLFGEFARME